MRYPKTVYFTVYFLFAISSLSIFVYTRGGWYLNEPYEKLYGVGFSAVLSDEVLEDLTVGVSSDLLVAEGDCVEKAVAITYILYRDGKLDEHVYAGVSDNHVQIMRVGDVETDYYDLLFWDVVKGSREFEVGDVVDFYEPFTFAAAALTFSPGMTKDELNTFVASWQVLDNESK